MRITIAIALIKHTWSLALVLSLANFSPISYSAVSHLPFATRDNSELNQSVVVEKKKVSI